MSAIGPFSANYTTTRPANDATATAADTWFQDCSAAGATDGTLLSASFFNVIIAQLREAIRAESITLDNSDDLMLSKAIKAAAANTLTASNGVRKVGSDIQLAAGSGTLTAMAAGDLAPADDLALVWDASANAFKETSIYAIVASVLANATGVTFNATTGKISFPAPQHTAASTPPASPAVGDTWFDTDTSILYTRTNDGAADIWLQIN